MIGERLILAALFLPVAAHLIFHLFKPLRNFRAHGNSVSILLTVGLLWWIWTYGEAVTLSMPRVFMVGMTLRIDNLAMFFAGLFGITAGVVSVFNTGYMKDQVNVARFHLFSQLTFVGCLGVILAGDLLTLFLFFEMMTFCSYILVIHRETRPAISAGNTYLFMGVTGGLILLLGIILLYSVAGTTEFHALPWAASADSTIMLVAAFCFLIGFGIKTGVVPLHIWMPQAYSVSPISINAFSSGIMIKTGAYGLLRVYTEIFFPAGSVLDFGPILGWILLWMGLASMLTGAFLALRQDNVLKTLAYSSISQIGYILMGLGVVLLPFGKPGYALSGMLFHILNHTVFKGTLFLIMAAIVYFTGTAQYSQLGGVFRKSRMLGVTFVISSLGIMGMPGLNGYASKTFLHHAVGDLYKYNPMPVLWIAEKIFVLASALTICYFLKLFFQVFWGEEGEGTKKIPPKMPLPFSAAIITGAVAVIAIGTFPGFVVKTWAVPAMTTVGATTKVIDYALNVNVWAWPDLLGMGITAVIGVALYFLVIKFKFDKIPFPQWLSVERMFYRPMAQGFLLFCMGPGVMLDQKVNQMYHGTGGLSYNVCQTVGLIDKSIDNLYNRAGSFSTEVCKSLGILDKQLSNLYDRVAKQGHSACINLSVFDQNLDRLYTDLGLVATKAVNKVSAMDNLISSSDPLPFNTKSIIRIKKVAKTDPVTWHISNLNVEAIVVAVALVVVVVIFVFYGR